MSRLVMLYALRYEKHPNSSIPLLIDTLGSVCGIPQTQASLVYKLLSQAGQEHRLGDLFGDDVLTRTKQMFKPIKGLHYHSLNDFLTLLAAVGAENVYTQHKSLVCETLEYFCKGKGKVRDGKSRITFKINQLEIIQY